MCIVGLMPEKAIVVIVAIGYARTGHLHALYANNEDKNVFLNYIFYSSRVVL